MSGILQLWGRLAPEDERLRLGRDRETPRWVSAQGSGSTRPRGWVRAGDGRGRKP